MITKEELIDKLSGFEAMMTLAGHSVVNKPIPLRDNITRFHFTVSDNFLVYYMFVDISDSKQTTDLAMFCVNRKNRGMTLIPGIGMERKNPTSEEVDECLSLILKHILNGG